MVSVIISPEEFSVHPVRESSGSLAQLERELDMMVKENQVAREVEVAVYQKAWYSGHQCFLPECFLKIN